MRVAATCSGAGDDQIQPSSTETVAEPRTDVSVRFLAAAARKLLDLTETCHGGIRLALSVGASDHGASSRRTCMAEARSGGNTGGIGLGGILVIVGIVLMIVWSFWIGLIIALVGLIAFGGFAKGKWY